MPAPIPILLLTGFLGAGKTTLLNRLIAKPGFEGTALIINEIGEIAVDHLLIKDKGSKPVLLAGGCICCAYAKELDQVLRELSEQVELGLIPPFKRVIVETTGLADPLPILERLATDAWIETRFRIGSVITVADAASLASGDALLGEAVAQIAIADRIIVTKTDLLDADGAARARHRLATLNGVADIVESRLGDVAEAVLLRPALHDHPARADQGRRLAAAHSSDVQIATLDLEGALPWSVLTQELDGLARRLGPALLRLKGLVVVENVEPLVAVHAVQGRFYPPELIDAGGEQDRRTRLVLIGRGIDVPAITEALRDRLSRQTVDSKNMELVP